MRKLYRGAGNISPFVRKVRIVLAEMGLDYEEEIGPGVRPSEEYRNVNPALTIPALVDGNRTLFDSSVIVEYLLETYSIKERTAEPPFAPTLVRVEAKWEDRKRLCITQSIMETAVALWMFKGSGIAPKDAAMLVRHQTRLGASLDWLESEATPTGFAPGLFTMTDIGLICAVGLIDVANETRFTNEEPLIVWRGRPNLESLCDHFSQRDSVAETSPAGSLPPFGKEEYVKLLLS